MADTQKHDDLVQALNQAAIAAAREVEDMLPGTTPEPVERMANATKTLTEAYLQAIESRGAA